MDSTTQVISVMALVITIALMAASSIITRERARRRRPLLALREIPAYSAMALYAGQAIEANRPMHLSLGSAGLGSQDTLTALAAAELFYYVAEGTTIGDIPPILTLSDASALPLGQDTLRRAYQARGREGLLRYERVRWYPSGGRSMAFAAALTALMVADDVSSNVLTGRFGIELALIMDASHHRHLPAIAASTQLEGQAVAYALSDHVLIGEEIFTAGAYLSDSPRHSAEALTLDVLRWLLIVAMLAVMLLTLITNRGG